MKGVNDDEILDFVELTKKKNVDIRFIEYMPFDGNKWNENNIIPYNVMLQIIKGKFPDFHRMKDGPNDTSKVIKKQ